MALEPLDRSRLVLAFGRHWRRDEVRWSTGNQWQMLGRVSDRRPGLRLCDFGWARGVYVLELRKKPVYVGIARGRMGFAERLVKHHVENKKQWTTFSWFSFDGVSDVGTQANPIYPQWARVKDRDAIARGETSKRIEEMEAIFVGLLGQGLTNVQKPKFGSALQWEQIVSSNYGRNGICSRADRRGFLASENMRFRE
ncbi:hypothetical protein V6K52_09185 [Knoellia sp. S7-12]|uniref:hypothetical protein n=1 Tax=Knoellia sp. S7-12 TaxID=3126698 RepID=UPI003365F2FA